MSIVFSRRAVLVGTVAAWPAFARAFANARASDDAEKRLAALEQKARGRLGVAVLDEDGKRLIAYRGGERFPLCSTFKFLASALVLARVDAKKESLDRRVTYTKADLVTYSPVTEKHVGDGMTMGALCEAALTMSDNTAGNLLLASFGGPAGLTAFARSLGDPYTRLDRIETALNEARHGDPRDTTTPLSMTKDMRQILLGPILSEGSRRQLARWMIANTTGGTRIRAGLPRGWKVGDKTGAGENGTTNDIAIVWPGDGAPLLVTAYLTECPGSAEERNATIAEAARIVSAELRTRS